MQKTEKPVMSNMRIQAWIAVVLFSAALNAKADDFARGSDLYAHHCQSCHTDVLHRSNQKVKNLVELRARVQAWAAHTGNGWRPQEVDDVVLFLNKSFYRF